MQNWYSKRKFISSLFVFSTFLFVMLLVNGCTNNTNGGKKSVQGTKATPEADGYTSYIKFRSFQNSDSTWGFTVFVNSKPYLQYRKIPFHEASTGFVSKIDAEKVATFFVREIEKGDLAPGLTKKLIDSLGVSLK